MVAWVRAVSAAAVVFRASQQGDLPITGWHVQRPLRKLSGLCEIWVVFDAAKPREERLHSQQLRRRVTQALWGCRRPPGGRQ